MRVPNSWLDANHPEGRLDSSYFRGSGTSQATAIVSGAVALVLQKYPNLTPDQVKKLPATSAYGLPATIGFQQGAGEIRPGEIRPGEILTKAPASYSQKFADATGTGSIEQARGDDHISQNGIALTGEQDIFGKPVDATALATAEANASSWSGGDWNGSSWSGSSWSGSSWSGSSWSGSSWSGSSWSGSAGPVAPGRAAPGQRAPGRTQPGHSGQVAADGLPSTHLPGRVTRMRPGARVCVLVAALALTALATYVTAIRGAPPAKSDTSRPRSSWRSLTS